MNQAEYKTMLNNTLRFHKVNKDKKNIKRVEETLRSLKC